MEMGTLVIDIDGTICSQEIDYSQAEPNPKVIQKINNKYDEGYHIILYTARGTKTGIDWTEITKKQLHDWGVNYNELHFGKPAGETYIDDRAINVYEWEPFISALSVIEKKWGKEYLLYTGPYYTMKRLELDKNKFISKQYHNYKHETWHIISGKGYAKVGEELMEVKPGDTVVIAPKVNHQVMATSNKLIIIEASTSQITDVVRVQEEFFDYGK